MKRLGLIAGTADYEAWAAEASAAPVATYDPATQRLLVPISCRSTASASRCSRDRTPSPTSARSAPLPHPAGVGDGAPLDDATRARLALVEGDATLAALDVVDADGDFCVPPRWWRWPIARAPPPARAAALARALSRFVHVDGFLFVAGARAPPRSAVDALWRDPPASSNRSCTARQIRGLRKPIPGARGRCPRCAGFDRPKASDVMGELVVRAWLSTGCPPTSPRRRRRLGRRSRRSLPGTVGRARRRHAARAADGVVDDLGRRRRGGGLRARRHDDARRERHAARRSGRAVLRRAGAGRARARQHARRVEDAVQACEGCSPPTRGSARLSTS